MDQGKERVCLIGLALELQSPGPIASEQTKSKPGQIPFDLRLLPWSTPQCVNEAAGSLTPLSVYRWRAMISVVSTLIPGPMVVETATPLR
jgi:hypothetical protein